MGNVILVLISIIISSSSLSASWTNFDEWDFGTTPAEWADSLVLPPGVSGTHYIEFGSGGGGARWMGDGSQSTGTLDFWIYDPAVCLESSNSGFPTRGPMWGVAVGSSGSYMAVGIARSAFVAECQGYSSFYSSSAFSFGWFENGLRGAQGIPFSAGWYKWNITVTATDISYTIFDVDYGTSDAPLHGDVTKTFSQNGVRGFWINGDGAGGPENIGLYIESGTGIFTDIIGDAPILDHIVIADADSVMEFVDITVSTDIVNLEFVCAGYDSLDNYIGAIDVQWELLGDLVGVLNPLNGSTATLNTSTPGTCRVAVTVSSGRSIADTSGKIIILPGEIVALDLLSAADTAFIGDTIRMFSLGYDADGNMSDFIDTVHWSTDDPGAVPLVNGLYISSQVGNHKIWIEYLGLSDTVFVTTMSNSGVGELQQGSQVAAYRFPKNVLFDLKGNIVLNRSRVAGEIYFTFRNGTWCKTLK